MAGMLAAGKAAVMDEGAAAGRASLREQRVPAATMKGEGERRPRAFQKERGDIGAAMLDDPGIAGQHRFAAPSVRDLGRRARDAEAGRYLGADRDQPSFRLPAPDRRMRKVARSAVVAD